MLMTRECNAQLTEINQASWRMQPTNATSGGCSLPFQKRHNVFWRRCGFGEWFARRVGSCAFKASLVILASSNIVVYPTFKSFHKTSERIRISYESQVTKSRTVCLVRFTTADRKQIWKNSTSQIDSNTKNSCWLMFTNILSNELKEIVHP